MTPSRPRYGVYLVSIFLFFSCLWPNLAQAQPELESQGLRFRLIPGGTYQVGSPPTEAGRYAAEPTPHKVSVKAFYLAVTETTNAQFARFLQATPRPCTGRTRT
jgi:formylglycine-generating enzyme required for sulfatase activity